MAVVTGLSEKRLARIGGRLEAFAGELFDGALVRSEQRAWSEAASAEWRGIVTLHALDLLVAHGRLEQHRQHVDDEQDHRDTEQADVDHGGEHPAVSRSAGPTME
jgi:hypothetical protein